MLICRLGGIAGFSSSLSLRPAWPLVCSQNATRTFRCFSSYAPRSQADHFFRLRTGNLFRCVSSLAVPVSRDGQVLQIPFRADPKHGSLFSLHAHAESLRTATALLIFIPNRLAKEFSISLLIRKNRHNQAERKRFFLKFLRKVPKRLTLFISFTFRRIPRGWISLFFNSMANPITPRLRIALRVMVSSLSSHRGRLVHCPAARINPVRAAPFT